MNFIYHNPPKGRKRRKSKAAKAKRKSRRRSGRKAPSAKQRANWSRFAKMARAKAGGRKRRKSRRTRARRSVVAMRSTKRATTVPRTRKKSRRRGRRSRAGVSARGFLRNPYNKEVLMLGAGALAATIAVPQVLARIGGKLVTNASGGIDANKYVAGKAIVGTGLAIVAAMLKQRDLAKGLAVGTVAAVGYDLAVRASPKLAPPLIAPANAPVGTAGWDGGYMGEIVDADPNSLGDYIDVPASLVG